MSPRFLLPFQVLGVIVMIDDRIRTMFTNGATYDSIAMALGVTRNVVAGRCRKMGLRRGRIVTPRDDTQYRRELREKRERAKDQRDIDILCDIDEGHDPEAVAEHWQVPTAHVLELVEAANG